MALPALVLTFALCLNGLAAVGNRVLAIDQAAQMARLIGRGQDVEAASNTMAVSEFTVERSAGLVCVTVSNSVGLFPMTARGCALDAGR